MKRKVGICGHFGFGKELLNGQTIKTKNVTLELEKEIGMSEIVKLDTSGGIKKIPIICVQIFFLLKDSKNVIIFPGMNGLKVFVPLCVGINVIFERKLHYVVIGGWLNQYLEKYKIIKYLLRYFHGIYVETEGMKKALNSIGIDNVSVMPNFKNIKMLSVDELIYNDKEPLKLCTFSRVMKEKGIEDAINAVIHVNEKVGRCVYILDIYGQIDDKYRDNFEKLTHTFPNYIRYCGMVSDDKSVEVIRDYYCLLFPTYYDGEGFAGTLLDAMAAGVPVIASDWKYNKEVIVEQKTGILIKACSVSDLEKKLVWILENKETWNKLKVECLQHYKKYISSTVIQTLVQNLE